MTAAAPHPRPSVDHCPLPAGTIAIGVAAIVLLILADTWNHRIPVIVTLGGVSTIAVGGEMWRRRHRMIATAVSLGGVAMLGIGFATAMTAIESISHRLILFLGVPGLALLGVALALPIGWYTRGVVMAGTGLVFGAVLTSGILNTVSLPFVVVTGTATILAWDAADHGVGLGKQVGRDARTWRASLVHLSMTALAGGVIAFGALAAHRFARVGLSLTALVVLILSCIALALAIRH